MKKTRLVILSLCLITVAIGCIYFYFYSSRPSKVECFLPAHTSFPFELTRSDMRIPCFQAKIEDIEFLVKLDLGYDGVLSLPQHILNQLNHKEHIDTALCANIQGKTYQNEVYVIPQLNIGNLVLANFPADESNSDFERDIRFNAQDEFEISTITARMGWQAFIGTVLLIDLSKSIAICADSIETIKEEGYPINQFVSTDLLMKRPMEFEAKIDNKLMKCVLDTGCTLNLLHMPLAQESALGILNKSNPPLPLVLEVEKVSLGTSLFHKISLPFETQAILGVDFLETQVVCIDLINNKLYLHPLMDFEMPTTNSKK